MVKEIVKIDLEKILFYYDGVQIFLGFDIENNEKSFSKYSQYDKG